MTSGLHKIEFPELASNNSTRPDLGLISLEGLRAVPARLEVHVGAVQLTVGELLSAQTGQVLRLDREVNSLVDLVLEGHVIARGRLVAVDEHFGIQLTELPRKDP
ncbi:MAG: FliM/FliN family flagellar motor switch protein [Burkholderiaceae bacterium]|nr:FliM/FliN family flagellar motor switch protein [Burkholderiaceae bacterium]